jgi:hypothetical protein
VADEDGEVVGYLVVVAEPDALLLDNVAVLPPHHGRTRVFYEKVLALP